MRNINVTVSGKSGFGKSSVAYIILKMLEDKGFSTELIDEYDETSITSYKIDEKIEAIIKNDTKITVITKREPRDNNY
jgi:nucleoside-triphosphatase THEP1